MFEEFGKKSPQNFPERRKPARREKLEQASENFNPDRRNFLIGASFFAASGILAGVDKKIDVAKSLGKLFAYWKRNKEIGVAKAGEMELKIETPDLVTKQLDVQEQKEAEQEKEEDCRSIRELISFKPAENVKLGEVEMTKLKNYWKKAYGEGKLKSSLESALVRMKDWEALAKKEFYAVGLEFVAGQKMSQEEKKVFWENFEKCFYLSIPESHWKLDDESEKSAVGPYQIIPETAGKYGLKRRYNYDERRDPPRSAKAAAQCLLGLYSKMENDWGLVISGYNGGMVWKFRKEAVENNREISYPNYLKYLEREIEKAKVDFSHNKQIFHKASRGDSWDSIAIKYKTNREQLLRLNNAKHEEEISSGDRVIILGTLENRREAFYVFIGGFSQNINYPAKLHAIWEVLEKKKKETGRDPLNQKSSFPRWREIPVKQVDLFFRHKVGKKEDLSMLAKKFGISSTEIVAKNGIEAIVSKQEILIRDKKKKPLTLVDVARKYRCSFEKMVKLNPVVKNPHDALPDGEVSIRVPA